MSRSRKAALIAIAAVMGLILAQVPLEESASATTQATYYASPTGSGSTCSITSPCSLTGSRDKVRTVDSSMTGDIAVDLEDGTYAESSPFALIENGTIHDSGTNGHEVIYQADTGAHPVISGGTTITGWTLYDATKGIYSATVPSNVNARQFYVSGVKAVRARSTTGAIAWTPTVTGFTANSSVYASWKNVSSMEVVWDTAWYQDRFDISSISGTTVTAANDRTPGMTWLENAYELIDTAGEWYLDTTGAVAGGSTHKIYYEPRAGENLSTAVTVLPSVQTLVSGTGSLDTPLTNVRFRGIDFQYSNWTGPSTDGYWDAQAGWFAVASDTSQWHEQPAALAFTDATHVTLERDSVIDTGGAGVSFATGSQYDTIIGSVFDTTAGNAIELGGAYDSHPSDPRAAVLQIAVQNNYIHADGSDYSDSVGIWSGYSGYLTISHNEIANVPYTGISVGWGWGHADAGGSLGYTTATTATHNTIKNNYIHDFMTALSDGGGIYTQSAQPSSLIDANYVRNGNSWQGLYPDEGSQNLTFTNNVVANVGEWLRIWTSSIQNNDVENNYANVTSYVNNGTNNTVTNNQTGLTSWPTAAQSIIGAAGLESAYVGIKPGTGTGVPATATASSTLTGWDASHVTDSDPATVWSSNSLGGPGGTPQWIQLDFGSTRTLGSITVTPRMVNGTVISFPSDFALQGSSDGTTWTTIPSQSYNSFANPTGVTTFTLGTPLSVRYLRMYATTFRTDDTGYYYFQLAGMYAQNAAALPTPTASASATLSGWDASNVLDSNTATVWSSPYLGSATASPQWIALNYGSPQTVSSLTITGRAVSGTVVAFPTAFTIQSSSDGTTWTTIGGQSFSAFATPTAGPHTFTLATPISTQYLRLNATGFSQDDKGFYYFQISDMSGA